jgi:probable rRNA maturation factor
MDANVEAFNEQGDLEVDLARWMRLARLVLESERSPGTGELSLIFVDRQAITDLNERFLQHSGPTDVLAFPMDDDLVVGGRQPDQGGRGPGAPSEAEEPPAIIGDVVVCPSVASEQAPLHGTAVDDEIALLVVHGVLHLLEYDHADPREEVAMQRRERELLAKFREMEDG